MGKEPDVKSFTDQFRALYRWVNDFSGGPLEVLRDAWQSFGDVRAAEAAAGMAYYALFSLFPLLIALVAAGSFVLEQGQVHQQAVELVSEAFPVSQGLIEKNVQRVLELRGTVGIVGLIGLFWAATGAFDILARNINRAWRQAESRSFVKSRLVALGMIGALAAFLFLSLLSSTLANVLPRLDVPLWGGVSIYVTPLWSVLSNLTPLLFSFLMFLALYLWTPTVEVEWKAAFWSAFVAALAWEGVANAFAWYLGSGFIQYELVYGSLGTVVALLLWIYLSSYITLFGAHLSAAIARSPGQPD
jgi:membrane protein